MGRVAPVVPAKRRCFSEPEAEEVGQNSTDVRGLTGIEERPLKEMVVPRKLFKIGEVMRYTGLSRQTIHNYTMLGLITEEERTESGHRLYGEDVFERLERIQDLKKSKTLKEIRAIVLRDSREKS